MALARRRSGAGSGCARGTYLALLGHLARFASRRSSMRKTIVFGVTLVLVQVSLLALTFIESDVFGGAGGDIGRRIALAPDGGFYVAGNTESDDGDNDAFLRKYNANRVLQWERAYGLPLDPTNGFDDEFI